MWLSTECEAQNIRNHDAIAFFQIEKQLAKNKAIKYVFITVQSAMCIFRLVKRIFLLQTIFCVFLTIFFLFYLNILLHFDYLF